MHTSQTNTQTHLPQRRLEFEAVRWTEAMLYPRSGFNAEGDKSKIETWLRENGFSPSSKVADSTRTKWLKLIDRGTDGEFLLRVVWSTEHASFIDVPGTEQKLPSGEVTVRLERCRWFGSVANPFGREPTDRDASIRHELIRSLEPIFRFDLGSHSECLMARYYLE